jgi:ABC-type branched-subunit amino acid transport system substrate-binding protein
MRARWSPVLGACFFVGCQSPEPARIGDAYPREGNSAVFLATIEPAVETTGLEIARWTVQVTGFPGWIRSITEQAAVFASDPGIIAVVGHPGSRDALLGTSIYNASGIPNVVPNATSARLGKAGEWTFTLVPNDSVQGEFLAHYAVDSLQAARISILYVGDEYGIGLRDGVRTALRRRRQDFFDTTLIPGGDCGIQNPGSVFGLIVRAALRRSQPDVMIIASGSINGWCAANLAHEANPTTWILFSDGMDGAKHVPSNAVHVKAERVRGVTFWEPRADSLNRLFLDRVKPALGRVPDASQALQYDAYMLLAAAVRDVGPDRMAIRNWLESLGRTRQPWMGVTGPIAFNRPRSEILRMTGPEEGER